MKYDNLGRNRHVAYPCDEEDEHGNPVRTWSIFRHGLEIMAGLKTRSEARKRAQTLDRGAHPALSVTRGCAPWRE